jgi:hypothetical protein
MKRTQLYMDDALFRQLAVFSREKKMSISELVRRAVKKVYSIGTKNMDPKSILDKSFGIWASRKDIPDVDKYVRALRSGSRQKRFSVK